MNELSFRKLKSKVILNGYNLKTFSKALNISYQTMYNKIKTGIFSTTDIKNISTILKLSDEEIKDIFF